MRILLVEDQPGKRDQIVEFVTGVMTDAPEIRNVESLRSALKEILEDDSYDLILLDMSMPNFDPASEDSADSSPESFAGRELLEQMKLRDLKVPVIVITQYSSFEGGTVTLEDLSAEFKREYGDFYLGSVYYNSAVETWKEKLLELWNPEHE